MALLDLSTPTLLAHPFFVLDGPEGERLACQWTAPKRGLMASEFEVVNPDEPALTGVLFGVYDPAQNEFRLRPVAHEDVSPHHARKVDLAWRGDLNSVMDCGHDWTWNREHGHLEISHEELED